MKSAESETEGLTAWRGVLLLGLLIWLLVWFAYRETFANGVQAGDFRYYYDASRLLHKGQSEYLAPAGTVRYVYTPLVALAIRPLARMPYDSAVIAWFFACVTFLLAAVFLFAAEMGLKFCGGGAVAILLLIAFHFRPSELDLHHGQFNIAMLALLCGGYLAQRRGRLYTLAALIAVAGLIKIWMLAMLGYLLLRRRPWAAGWGAAVYIAGLAALFAEARQWLRITTAAVVRPIDFGNQSIIGFANVRFHASDVAQPLVNSPFLGWVVVALGFAGLAYGMWQAWRIAAHPTPRQASLCLSFTMATLLLGMPICQRPYFVYLLPAFWTLLIGPRIAWAWRIMALAAYVTFTFEFSPPWHAAPGWPSWSYSAFFFAAVVTWGALLGALRQKDGAHP
jgi:hypothetical protein